MKASSSTDFRAAARASMRPRLMMPSYLFWWALLRLPHGERIVKQLDRAWLRGANS